MFEARIAYQPQPGKLVFLVTYTDASGRFEYLDLPAIDSQEAVTKAAALMRV